MTIRKREPWNFPTPNVRMMLRDSMATAEKASPGNPGCTEEELLVAINDLRHAADELERSHLEMAYGVKRKVNNDD